MNFISEALGSQSQHSRTKKDQQSLETKFQLYTDTTGEACQILFNQLETLDKCSFNASLPLVMIVHGWSVWTHILFLIQTTSDLIYFPPRYASAKSNFRRKIRISKMVEIIAKNNEKWQFPTEILKECSRNNFSYGNSMPGISFYPGLKPAELEQAAESRINAMPLEDWILGFIPLVCSLPGIYRLLEKNCIQTAHIFLTGTPAKRTSL